MATQMLGRCAQQQHGVVHSAASHCWGGPHHASSRRCRRAQQGSLHADAHWHGRSDCGCNASASTARADVRCSATKGAVGPSGGPPVVGKRKRASVFTKPAAVDDKEAHKLFDEVVITVKSGDGGRGEEVESSKGRWVPNLKYRPGGNQAKKIWLPASEPADGADGADVVLVCDPSQDSLLHLHARKQYTAPRGSNANPALGSSGPKNNRQLKKPITAPFEIPVPPGTVVKRKGTGALLGELINPGDRLVVARGGRGGSGVVVPSREQRLQREQRALRKAQEEGTEVVQVEDRNWRLDAEGAPGQQLTLNLLLRVVADVGIVGFPNAGKSSLLRCTTNASPEVAPYPFTTLMPNLGVLASGASGSSKTVMADLPGLIEGAHTGKGLGRMFLRHLRRTHALLHVVDASGGDPAGDYVAVREELRMYNPEYCARPHVVALNKADLLESVERAREVVQAVLAAAAQHCQDWAQEEVKPLAPAAIVAVSAATGQGLGELNKALAHTLKPSTRSMLAAKGSQATWLLTDTLLPSSSSATTSASDPAASAAGAVASSGSPAVLDDADRAASRQLQFFNSKVQGADAWSGARMVLGGAAAAAAASPAAAPPASSAPAAAAQGGEEEEGEQEEPLAPLSVEDAWLFELSDEQLSRLVEQDEGRAAGRERAARAAGRDPYEALQQDPNAPPEGEQAPAAAAAGPGDVKAAPGGGASQAQEGDGGSDEDEWVELTAEELELLQWMDEYEAQQAQAEEEGVGGGPAGGVAERDEAGVSCAAAVAAEKEEEDDRWLFELGEEELEALAEGRRGGDDAGGWGAAEAAQGGGEQQEQQADEGEGEGAALDAEDRALLALSEEELLELAERGDDAWAQRGASS